MQLDLSNASADIPCPACSKKFKQALGGLKDQQNVTCPSCGVSFTLDAKKLIDGFGQAEKLIDDFLRNLK